MKTINIAAIAISVLMLIPLGFGLISSIINIVPTVNTELTDKQMREICSRLKFEIKPDENVYVEYWPTVLQATTRLEVNIENVTSEADFLTRFHGLAKEMEPYQSYDRETYYSAYNVEIFQLDRIPKDYWCGLYFADEDGSVRAKFYISGFVPDLKNIYSFSHKPFRPLLNNLMFIIPLIIEAALIIFFVVQASIFLHKRKSVN